jgi:hypothetical protein
VGRWVHKPQHRPQVVQLSIFRSLPAHIVNSLFSFLIRLLDVMYDNFWHWGDWVETSFALSNSVNHSLVEGLDYSSNELLRAALFPNAIVHYILCRCSPYLELCHQRQNIAKNNASSTSYVPAYSYVIET